ncbi:DnaB-like helicase C-terminal domain-containing protein [Pseudomonas sp. CCC3.2]|uniref:replicative DNA helicase n=1 Tax=unclassified Pseudomonas TaxID=196821 RepID=UPI002AB4A364|nr:MULTISPECIES: DnaB-like helicase C-terminal domain-containing protein [unclassified Pseudomonas]MDY7560193.1 DnaB-like helicase C-terminal domain-containing protein [Pseudomonas sp. AB6]MEB0178742.1 DnaB-like helicase C-terminal domain-containing protein [Pseudomonas sp. CCC3.2]MEB0211380.1 DnaB-like helicase C-terminal domain-containing protein [Pseudomonas sp. AB6]
MSRDLFSIPSEHGLLGAIFVDPTLLDEISGKVNIADFHELENAALYRAILDCHAAGDPVDIITVSNHHPTLPCGSSMLAHAAEVHSKAQGTSSWKTYARVIRERSVLRQVVLVAESITESASEDKSVAEIIALGQQALVDLRDLDDGEQDYYRANEILPGVIDTIDAKYNKTAPKGLTTGLPDLDKLIRGLRAGNLITIGGLTGSGKTILGVQIAQHVTCSLGHSGLIFSMEMTREELITRGIASMGGVSLTRLDEGESLDDDDWPRITGAVRKLDEARLYVNDQAGMTVARIRSIARQCQRREGLDVLVVDYIQLIATAGNGQNRTLEIGKISIALKNLAKELKVPVIVLAQLNRGPTNRPDKRPRPSDIRDSGQIEQDSDVVILVHKDMETEAGRNGITELIVGKCRHAQVGSCNVQQEGKFVRFVSFGGKPPSNEEVEMGRSYASRSKGRNS